MSKRINGSGPTPAKIMLIGQRPGIEEIRRGKPFVGKAGMELDRYLFVNASISRADCFVTNLVRDFDGKDELTEEEIKRDWPDLMEEVKQVAPHFIGLVGLYSTRAILGNDYDMDWCHGLRFSSEGGWVDLITDKYETMPLIHPAAGLHRPQEAARIAWDFTQFGKMVRGEPLPSHHLMETITKPGLEYREATDETGIHILAGVDTEGTVEHPWCLSFSTVPGIGVVDRRRICQRFRNVVLHNAIHDLPVLAAMGVVPSKWTDTMMMAALLGVEPQNLKALARRHCGMVMQEYEDVIRDARRDKALEYLSKVVDWCPLDPVKTKRKARIPKSDSKWLKELTEEALNPTTPSPGHPEGCVCHRCRVSTINSTDRDIQEDVPF